MAWGDKDYRLLGTEGLQITHDGVTYTLDEDILCHVDAPVWVEAEDGWHNWAYCDAVGRLTDDENGNSREVYYDFDSIEQMEEWEKNQDFSSCITGILVTENDDDDD